MKDNKNREHQPKSVSPTFLEQFKKTHWSVKIKKSCFHLEFV